MGQASVPAGVPYANLFRLRIVPSRLEVFRADLKAVRQGDDRLVVRAGRFGYSLHPGDPFTQAIAPDLSVIHLIVRKTLGELLSRDERFFDVASFDLGASVGRNLLHKEPVFSIARRIHAQVIFDAKDLYLAVWPTCRIYNRLRLVDVLGRLGRGAFRFPLSGLCFAGSSGDERWRDCRILGIGPENMCIVNVPTVNPPEFGVPAERVVPRLPLTQIRQLQAAVGSQTPIERKLIELRRGRNGDEGLTAAGAIRAVVRDVVLPLFPLRIGGASIELDTEPTSLASLNSGCVDTEVQFRSGCDSKAGPHASIRTCLASATASTVKIQPVALFVTSSRREGLLHLVDELNRPSAEVGGFAGMPKNFGIKLAPVTGHPIVTKSITDYVRAIEAFVLSPDPQKQGAIALIALNEDEALPGDNVPLYYRLKSQLARAGYKSQVVAQGTLRNRYALWNLGLNLCAKLGGTPWTLANDEVLRPVDLFLGFSYSTIHTEALGERRNIAFTNVFDRGGNWKSFYADAEPFGFEQRLSAFPRLARYSIESAADDPGCLRMVEVHYNKRFGHLERKAIAEGVRSIAPRASIMFVSITDDHPIRLFEPGRPQQSARRGTWVRVSNDQGYLQTCDGDKLSGFPRPVRIHMFNDFTGIAQSLEEVSRRVLALARLNWRSVRECACLPVTILYSARVARLANYFGIDEWKRIDHGLKRTPWFL